MINYNLKKFLEKPQKIRSNWRNFNIDDSKKRPIRKICYLLKKNLLSNNLNEIIQ